MRGTGYAIVEIIWWMLAAAAVGFLIGWVLRRWSLGNELAAEWEQRFAAEQKRSAAAADEAAKLKDKVAKLEAELAAADTRIKGLQSDFDAKAAELDDARSAAASRDALDAELASLRDHAAELERELAERNERIATLEGTRSATQTAAAAAPSTTPDDTPAGAPQHHEPAPPSGEAAAPAGDLPDKDTALARVAEIAQRTRGDGPVVDDDLKQIRGIGPKLEELLKSLDITSFRQVANFMSEDIAYVTAALDAFPGRIERDDWMSSAAEQHLKKYGSPAR